MAAAEFVEFEPPEEEWMRDAACKGLTYLFFPSSAERPQARERREAMARHVCSTCAVQAPCREFARGNHEYGFWGGESEDERHAAGYRLIAPIGVRARVG
jgi:WhiB family redox-sensing transcriptional regulator